MTRKEVLDLGYRHGLLPVMEDGEETFSATIGELETYTAGVMRELQDEIDKLRELVYDAFVEGFNEGKYGTWVVGPEIHPWKASECYAELQKDDTK